MQCPHGLKMPVAQNIPEDDMHSGMMDFYVACDCCDYLMHMDSHYFYDQKTGETLCCFCAGARKD